MATLLSKQEPGIADREHSLRKALIIPLPAGSEKLAERFGLSISTIYHMTEICAPLFSLTNPLTAAACGKPRQGTSLRLINYAVPQTELDAKVDALADELAAGATWAIRWTKTVMNLELRRLNTLMTDVALAYETTTNHMTDHQEAVNAFREKRRPVFTGT